MATSFFEQKVRIKEEQLVDRYGNYEVGTNVATIISGLSIMTIGRMFREEGNPLKGTKRGVAFNSPVRYSMENLARYLIKKEFKEMQND